MQTRRIKCPSTLPIHRNGRDDAHAGHLAVSPPRSHGRQKNQVLDSLSCQCDRTDDDECIVDCQLGRSIMVSRRCWAGDKHERTITATREPDIFSRYNKSAVGPSDNSGRMTFRTARQRGHGCVCKRLL